MNKKLGLAVAGALLALSSTANAGISIPAGDWTLDVSGNVNAFYINNRSSDNNTVVGGLANKESGNADSNSSSSSMNTGLLPSWLTVGAKTRQNDLDVAWAISFQPGASTTQSLKGGGGSEFRQAYFTFGDASWGTIKLGKDLGVFGSDAILSDMTLLGVGSGAATQGGGATTTLGRIGTGYLYADFNAQMNYSSPNWNGFQFTAGIAQPLNTNNNGAAGVSAASTGAQSDVAYEAKASYSFTGDVAGKVWAEAKTQNVDYAGTIGKERANAWGLGANVNVAGFGLTGYYYDAKGVGTTAWLIDGVTNNGKRRDSDGYYVQATYALPTATKVGVSYGKSNLDRASNETKGTLVEENKMLTIGAYHPLTKSVNLVAEYSKVKSENQLGAENESKIVSLGGILFF